MRDITRILMTFIGIAVGGFFGFAISLGLAMDACDSSGFLSEDQCKQGWGAFFILPLFIAGLVGGGIWGYKGLGGKAANWVMGSEEQTVSKNLPGWHQQRRHQGRLFELWGFHGC